MQLGGQLSPYWIALQASGFHFYSKSPYESVGCADLGTSSASPGEMQTGGAQVAFWLASMV